MYLNRREQELPCLNPKEVSVTDAQRSAFKRKAQSSELLYPVIWWVAFCQLFLMEIDMNWGRWHLSHVWDLWSVPVTQTASAIYWKRHLIVREQNWLLRNIRVLAPNLPSERSHLTYSQMQNSCCLKSFLGTSF